MHYVALGLWVLCAGWWVAVIAYDKGVKHGRAKKRRELVEGLDYMLETGQVVILTKIEHEAPPPPHPARVNRTWTH